MTALVSENTIDSRPVSIQMRVRGESAVYCTTDLCLSVDKLKKEKKETGWERCLCTEVNVYVLYILSTVKTDNTNLSKGKR